MSIIQRIMISLLWLFGSLAYAGTEIIIDNQESGFSIELGDWGTCGGGACGGQPYGPDFRWAPPRDEGSPVRFRARFTPHLPTAGDYEVYVWWPQGSDRATDAPITVYHTSGESRFTVDLRNQGSHWHLLGRFFFSAGTDGSVVMEDATTGYTNADAVRFVLVSPPLNENIVLTLEEPGLESVYSGVSNIRGWAVAPQGLQKIELYVDGVLGSNLPLGGKRTDVGAAYPSYPGAADSGFAMAYNYSSLTTGPHTLTVRAYDNAGGAHDASAVFTVARFATAFMADPAAVNLDQATLARSGNTITIQNLLAAGQSYNAQLTWRPAAQGFALTQINPAGGAPTAGADPGEPTNLTGYASSQGSGTAPSPPIMPLLAQPTAGENIVLALEEPTNSSTYSGISNVRGWTVAPQGLQRIELYVDGALQGNIPLGGRRSDVGATYPNYPGSSDAGFAMAYNYSNLAAGPHTLTVRAYDNAGGARDASATFTVARFASPFMADPAAVNLDQATLARSGNTITLQNLIAEGQRYQAQLTWRPAAQGFALTQIEESMNSCRATLSPSTLNVPAGGGTGNISVSIPSGCPWTASSEVPWVRITSGASGVGSGAVVFTALANWSNVQRSGTLTIASQAVTLRQESGDPGGGGQ